MGLLVCKYEPIWLVVRVDISDTQMTVKAYGSLVRYFELFPKKKKFHQSIMKCSATADFDHQIALLGLSLAYT